MSKIYTVVTRNETTLEDDVVLTVNEMPTERQLQIVATLFDADVYTIIKHSFNRGIREEVTICEMRKEYAIKDFKLDRYISKHTTAIVEMINRHADMATFAFDLLDFTLYATANNITTIEMGEDASGFFERHVDLSINGCYVADDADVIVEYKVPPSVLVEVGNVIREYIINNF